MSSEMSGEYAGGRCRSQDGKDPRSSSVYVLKASRRRRERPSEPRVRPKARRSAMTSGHGPGRPPLLPCTCILVHRRRIHHRQAPALPSLCPSSDVSVYAQRMPRAWSSMFLLVRQDCTSSPPRPLALQMGHVQSADACLIFDSPWSSTCTCTMQLGIECMVSPISSNL
jgi:hypothetical protein